MKKMEIKKVTPKSVLKVTMYMMVVPAALCFIIGMITALVGVLLQEMETFWIGIGVAVGYPILLVAIYALFSALIALIYNLLAGKFGGLELVVSEKDEHQ